MTNSLLLIGKHVSTRRAFPNTGCRKDAAGRQKGGVSPSGVRQSGRSTSLWTMPRLAVSIVDILPTASVCTWDAKAKSWDFSSVARTVLSLIEEYLSGGCRSGLVQWPDRDGVETLPRQPDDALPSPRRSSPMAATPDPGCVRPAPAPVTWRPRSSSAAMFGGLIVLPDRRIVERAPCRATRSPRATPPAREAVAPPTRPSSSIFDDASLCANGKLDPYRRARQHPDEIAARRGIKEPRRPSSPNARSTSARTTRPQGRFSSATLQVHA